VSTVKVDLAHGLFSFNFTITNSSLGTFAGHNGRIRMIAKVQYTTFRATGSGLQWKDSPVLAALVNSLITEHVIATIHSRLLNHCIFKS